MITHLSIFCFIALIILSACATPDLVLPPPPDTRAADMRRAELKVEAEKQGEEFKDKWTYWNAKAKELHADLEAINQESTLAANHPGWSDMAQILKNSASIRYLEGEESAAQKRAVALTQWSQKWQANGAKIYEKSRWLFNRIAVTEAACHALEKDYEKIRGLHQAWTLLMTVGLSEEGAAFIWKNANEHFSGLGTRTLTELATLLKKTHITLGFAEKEKP